MSTSLDIMTEENFNIYINEYDEIKVYNPMVLFEKLSQYYTNFSGKTYR